MSRPPRLRRRLLGLALLLILAEVALQLAGPLAQSWFARRDPAPGPDSALTILCVGDSNTYGLNVPRSLAWPARLAGRLRPRYDAPIAVLNRGVPGRNSAQVAQALGADLDEIRADLVLIQVGVNDTWNTAVEEQGWTDWLGRLKLVRLVRVLAAGVTTSAPAPFEVGTDADGEFVVSRGERTERVNPGRAGLVRRGPSLQASLERGLVRAVKTVREHGALPVLLTYPEFQDAHGEVNAILRRWADQQGVTLVDLEASFRQHFQDASYGALMFNDHHPNARGYELLAGDLEAALDELDLLAPPREREARQVVRSPPSQTPRLEARPGGGLELQGPPGWAFQVAVGRLAGAGQGLDLVLDSGPARLPLMDDDLLTASRTLPSLSGWLDDQGRARLDVSPALVERAGGTPLWACLLLLHDPDDPGAVSLVAAVSQPVQVAF